MKKINNTFIILLLLAALLLIILIIRPEGPRPVNLREEKKPAGAIGYNLSQLVLMENNAAKDDASHTSKEEVDYTKLFPDLYTELIVPRNTDKDKKIAYLTFDDGPSENTYKVLDILQEEEVKATFFIVGSTISKKEEKSLKRMINEGHVIGIHTYSHMCNEIYCSVERFLEDFNKVYQQIYEVTGERVNIYRFPWGSNNGYSRNIKDALMEEMERRGFTCYDWNVSGDDSIGRPTRKSIRKNIRKDLLRYNDPIILLHDSMSNTLTVEMLPEIIQMIREQGYEFDTLDNREPYQFPW